MGFQVEEISIHTKELVVLLLRPFNMRGIGNINSSCYMLKFIFRHHPPVWSKFHAFWSKSPCMFLVLFSKPFWIEWGMQVRVGLSRWLPQNLCQYAHNVCFRSTLCALKLNIKRTVGILLWTGLMTYYGSMSNIYAMISYWLIYQFLLLWNLL